ncbi:hypothetical protein MMC19_001351 [Ptychographa xylographoides]|nr:hypothetical protein [Ptychographa xylographoides]
MASKKDMRRTDLGKRTLFVVPLLFKNPANHAFAVIPYVEPPKDTKDTDMSDVHTE